MDGEKRILVPLDLSPASKDILEMAETIAEKEGCGLVILHVVEPFDVMRQRPPLILTDVLDDYARLLRRIPRDRVTVRALEGDPVDVILDAASGNQCHMIVMGHGRKEGRPGHVADAVQNRFHGRTHLVKPVKESVKGGASC